jgi:signal transduction histidine kinase/CheY-like chemotaxis protein
MMNGNSKNFAFSLKRLESVVKLIQSGLAITDENGKFTLVNQAFLDILKVPVSIDYLIGQEAEKILNTLFAQVVKPEDFRNIMSTITHSREMLLEKEIQLENGQLLQVNFIPSIEGENYYGYLWTFRDISEQYNSQQSIQANKDFYEEILNNLPSDVVVFTPEHKYYYINQTAIRDPEVRKWMLGKTDYDFCKIRNKDIQLAINRDQLFKEVVETRKKVEFLEEGTFSTGEVEYKLRNLHPVTNPEGEIKMVIGYGLDITKRKIIEIELEKSRKEAEENAAAKEILLANVSHELRTPLNGINGILEILSDSGLTEVQKHLVALLQHSSLNLLTLVNDLLNLAQINRGEIILYPSPTNITNLLKDISGIFELQATEKKIRWKFDSSLPEDLYILADKTRVTQILNNLIGNAIKFTQSGEICFTAQTLKSTPTEALLEFRVKDTGPGIEDRLLDKVFDAFTRLHPEPQQFNGTGLGLNITHNLVKLQGGTIEVKSKIDEGSEFIVKISFPIVENTPAHEFESSPPKISSQNILIIEDHPVNRFMLNNQLEKAGHTISNAENAQIALELIENNQFDIILLDFNLPDIPGQELIRMIQKTKAGQNIPIIAITANTLPETRIIALSSGFSEFISKPYKSEELINKIAFVISKKMNP